MSENPEESDDDSAETAPRPAPPEGRVYRRVVYARVTEAEWEVIRKKASGANVSMSRYLVRSALARGSVPSREEKARLEDSLYRMRRASIRLRQLAGLRWVQSADPDAVEMLREAASLLEQLVQEMTRRLYGGGR